MNMREKIARAIAYHVFGSQDQWTRCFYVTHAVLEAMREPTDEMIEAGYGEHNNGSPRDRYAAMIDAAREGK